MELAHTRLGMVFDQLDRLTPLHVTREIVTRIFRVRRHYFGVLRHDIQHKSHNGFAATTIDLICLSTIKNVIRDRLKGKDRVVRRECLPTVQRGVHGARLQCTEGESSAYGNILYLQTFTRA